MKLILLRHGESDWNKLNKFCGWIDVGLSEDGIQGSLEAANLLKEHHLNFDIAFTSVLKRTVKTCSIILQNLNLKIPVIQNWQLNERHYGVLQGLNKQEATHQYSFEQVSFWRRSYHGKSPEIAIGSEYDPSIDPKYQNILEEGIELPRSESLSDCVERIQSFWENEIASRIKENKNILIVAHGTSIRALIKIIEKISDEDIAKFEIPNGYPYVIQLNQNLEPTDSKFLGSKEAIEQEQIKIQMQIQNKKD